MSAVEASAGTYRSRVDGTLVLSVEIEPRFRAAALELFGMPGTPMALAALKVKAGGDDGANRTQVKGAPEPPAPAEKGGPLSVWAALRCKEPEFQGWIARKAGNVIAPSEEGAAGFIRLLCNVESRAEIDSNPEAERKFHEGIRGPYSKWLAARGK